MSSFATAGVASSGRKQVAALALALTAVATWLVATIAEFLWFPAAALGLAALVLGRKARSNPRRDGSSSRLALAAMIVGGLLAALVIVWTVVWGISTLV